MAWDPRRAQRRREPEPVAPVAPELLLESMTIKELLEVLGRKVGRVLETGPLPAEEELAKKEISQRLTVYAAQLGITVAKCKMPGCELLFVKVPQNRDFCGNDHKIMWNNNYRARGDRHAVDSH
jgi:hypothetical protein